MGIPNRADYGDFDRLRPGGLYDYYIQRHAAARAGVHHDVRVGSPTLGLYSFATRKGLPEAGGKPIALFQQPVHAHSYGGFSGTIGRGYGAGQVQLVRQGKVFVTDINKDAIHFATADGTNTHRFVLVRPKGKAGGKQWLAIHQAPPDATGLEKKHYKLIPPDQADEVLANLEQNAVVQPKVDGAMVYAKLRKNRMEILSHRISKRTGKPIVHTERFFKGQNPRFDFPKRYRGAVLLAELHGLKNGKAIPAQALGGILNSGLAKSVADQRSRGIQLKSMLYGIGSMPGVDTSKLTYSQSRAILEDVHKHLPSDKFTLPEEAKGPAAAQALLAKIYGGKHPLTQEGLILHPQAAGSTPQKIKSSIERDVFVHSFFPGEGRLANQGVGGFRYSLAPNGPAVGKVGSGLDDEIRRELLRNPDQYVGRRAKIQAQESYPSGAYRVPVFHAFHEDY